jgi:hypothetical protein
MGRQRRCSRGAELAGQCCFVIHEVRRVAEHLMCLPWVDDDLATIRHILPARESWTGLALDIALGSYGCSVSLVFSTPGIKDDLLVVFRVLQSINHDLAPQSFTFITGVSLHIFDEARSLWLTHSLL